MHDGSQAAHLSIAIYRRNLLTESMVISIGGEALVAHRPLGKRPKR